MLNNNIMHKMKIPSITEQLFQHYKIKRLNLSLKANLLITNSHHKI